jgi:hypothetical protein
MTGHTTWNALARMLAAAALAPVAAGLVSCASPAPVERDGVGYGVTEGVFRGKWWSYYERGASYLAGGYVDEAVADFRKALRARDDDAWAARTYGLHFTEYFPNRELGVALYLQGDLGAAEDALQRSLADVDSHRARHYLDLVTQARLDAGILEDAGAPRLDTALADDSLFAGRQVPVPVAAADDLGVQTLLVNGRALPQRGSAAAVEAAPTLELDEGAHVIRIAARDLAGRETAQDVAVRVDLSGPVLGIREPAPGTVTEASRITIRGAAVDASGVASATLDGRPLAVAGSDAAFQAEVPLVAGENTFVVAVTDNAGNTTTTAVAVFQGAPAGPDAQAWRRARQTTPTRIASAALTPGLLAAAAEPGDAPVIRMKFPRAEGETVPHRKRELRLAGRVEAPAGLTAFRIQDDAYPVVPDATHLEFSRRIPVEAGRPTPVQVSAEDAAGNRETWSATVVGEPVVLDEYRMALAVQHFEGAPAAMAPLLDALFVAEFGKVAQGRFAMVDRAQLEAVLTELELGASELADPRLALRLGQVRPADALLYSVVHPRDGGGVEILTRAVSTETGSVLGTYDTFVADWDDPAARRRGIEGLAAWFATQFPRVPGAVVRVAAGKPYINLGADDGVKKDMRVVLTYEAAPPIIDETTGETLEDAIYDALGVARIVGVDDERSKLGEVNRTVEGEAAIEAGQPVFTM